MLSMPYATNEKLLLVLFEAASPTSKSVLPLRILPCIVPSCPPPSATMASTRILLEVLDGVIDTLNPVTSTKLVELVEN